jgi:hypothetical protein
MSATPGFEFRGKLRVRKRLRPKSWDPMPKAEWALVLLPPNAAAEEWHIVAAYPIEDAADLPCEGEA